MNGVSAQNPRLRACLRKQRSKPSPCFDKPALTVFILEAGQMLPPLLGSGGQAQLLAQTANAFHGPVGILKRLTEQGLGLFWIAADLCVQR